MSYGPKENRNAFKEMQRAFRRIELSTSRHSFSLRKGAKCAANRFVQLVKANLFYGLLDRVEFYHSHLLQMDHALGG